MPWIPLTAPTCLPRPPAPEYLELDDVGGRRALRTLLCVVAHLRALGQRLEAAALDRAVMHEQILALVIGRDEPKALVIVEPLNGSCCHLEVSLRYMHCGNAEGAKATTAVTRALVSPSNARPYGDSSRDTGGCQVLQAADALGRPVGRKCLPHDPVNRD